MGMLMDSARDEILSHAALAAEEDGGICGRDTFDEGKNVKKGDVLARLETTEYQSYHDSARAKAARTPACCSCLLLRARAAQQFAQIHGTERLAVDDDTER